MMSNSKLILLNLLISWTIKKIIKKVNNAVGFIGRRKKSINVKTVVTVDYVV